MNDKGSVLPKEEILAAGLKALSHPARIAILRTLAGRNMCICGELVDVLPLAQSTVSQHIRVLRDAGLIEGETDGPRSCYCVDMAALRQLRAQFVQLFEDLELSRACC